MTENKDLAKVRRAPSGKFTDVADSLLPLFSDPDGRGGRRWREMFGFERPAPPARGGIAFGARKRRSPPG